MNKFAILTLSMAASLSVLAVPLAAQEIIVSPAQYDVDVAKVGKDLDKQLARIRLDPLRVPAGIAQVRFRIGEDGKPHAVTTYRRSGDSRLDKAAIRAVNGLTGLDRSVFGFAGDRLVQANIIIATSESQFDRLSRRLQREEASRIASSRAERAVVALTVSRSPSRS